MHGNSEVVDLHTYQWADPRFEAAPGPQCLPPRTGLMLGQYSITGYLNCGGFGITYIALDSLGRTVVLKECFPAELCIRAGRKVAPRSPACADDLAAAIRQFIDEAHRLAAARHPNVVHVHQIFEDNDTAYIVMDFIDGPNLLEIVAWDPTRFSPKEILSFTLTMLGAIGHIHDRGLLHRDISPDNILVARDGTPVLIDFGAAREHDRAPDRVRSRLKVVKDGYSPHEFYITGTEQGTWSDLYSFAATMYHLITRVPPVDAQTRLGALAARKPDPYVPLAGTVAGYPERFLEAIDKAISILPGKRIPTAEAWLDMIAPGPTDPVAGSRSALRATRLSAVIRSGISRLIAASGLTAP